jgi:hypothetical protein
MNFYITFVYDEKLYKIAKSLIEVSVFFILNKNEKIYANLLIF